MASLTTPGDHAPGRAAERAAWAFYAIAALGSSIGQIWVGIDTPPWPDSVPLWVRALLVGDDRHVQPLAPDLQLVDGGSAKGISGGQHHAAAELLVIGGELGDIHRAATAEADNRVHGCGAPGLDRGKQGFERGVRFNLVEQNHRSAAGFDGLTGAIGQAKTDE